MFIPLKYNIRYLITRRGGTLMTALTFALVVAIFVVVMSLARGMEKALAASGNPLNVLVMRPGVQAEGQSSIQIPRYPIVRAFPGIAVDEQGEPLAGPEVLVLVNKPKRGSGKPSNIQVRGVTAASFKIRPEVKLVEGRLFRPGLREAVISKRAANRFEGMSLGDHPRLGRGEWTIVGIFDAQGSAFDSELWCDDQELMEEFDRDAYSTIVLRAADKAAVESIAQLLDADPRVKLIAKTEEKYYQEQTSNATPLKVFGGFLAIMMSIGACFAAMNTMYSNVANRVREIGTLRILGFTPFSILISFLVESIALSLIGGSLGCLFSLPINGLATGTTNFETFSEIVFYFTITPELMVRGLAFAVIMGAFGGLLPAIYAARQPILQALRHV